MHSLSSLPPGFCGLIPVSEDDTWGADAPTRPLPGDPACSPPLAPLLADLAAGEAAAVEAAFAPARALVAVAAGGAAALPPAVTVTPPPPLLSSVDALEASALAALDAGDVPGAAAHLRAAAAAAGRLEGAAGDARRARIARYLKAAEACLGQ